MRPGDLVVVTFGGGWGAQFARVMGFAEDGRVRVRKWRDKGRRWTGPVLEAAARVRPVGEEDRLKPAYQRATEGGLAPWAEEEKGRN